MFFTFDCKEMDLFTNKIPLEKSKLLLRFVFIIYGLHDDYATKGNLIKWNPSVKTENDRKALWEALLDNRIDVIATDHSSYLRRKTATLF
jgi:dihydroorotase